MPLKLVTFSLEVEEWFEGKNSALVCAGGGERGGSLKKTLQEIISSWSASFQKDFVVGRLDARMLGGY